MTTKYSIEARRRYQASGKDEKVKKVCELLGQLAIFSDVDWFSFSIDISKNKYY